MRATFPDSISWQFAMKVKFNYKLSEANSLFSGQYVNVWWAAKAELFSFKINK